VISQGDGWPEAANANPPADTPHKITAKAINRLNTCIVVIAPCDEKEIGRERPTEPCTAAWIDGVRHKARRLGGAAGQGETPASQTTIRAQSQCTKSISAMRQHMFCGFLEKAGPSRRGHRPSYDIDRIGRFGPICRRRAAQG